MRISRLLTAVICVALTLASSVRVASATMITFEDLAASLDENFQGALQNGYASLNWTNFGFYEQTSHFIFPQPNGYQNAGSPIIAFNGFGSPASISSTSLFTLVSFDLLAAWESGLPVTVLGKRNGVTVDSALFVVDPFAPTHEVLNWENLDEVDFSTVEGTACTYGCGTHFVLDNVEITPLPATLPMFAGGLAIVGLLSRRNHRLGSGSAQSC